LYSFGAHRRKIDSRLPVRARIIACYTDAFQDTKNSSAVIDTQLDEIDWVVQSFQQRKLDLSTRRNLLSYIARLPLETLVHVFWLCVETDLDFLKRAVKVRSFRTYAAVSHVCHAWRVIALGTPSLWTRPLFSKMPMTKAMVARAKGLPLMVKCELKDSNIAHVAPLLQAYPLRSVSLSGLPQRLKKAYAALAKSLPHLQYLRLEASPPENEDDLEEDVDEYMDHYNDHSEAVVLALEAAIAVPCDMVNVNQGAFVAPSLSNLFLKNTFIPISSGLFRYVTDFTFHLLRETPGFAWSTHELLEILDQFSHLQHLDLFWRHEEGLQWASNNVIMSSLAGLRHLRLYVPDTSRQALLCRIKPQALEKLTIKMAYGDYIRGQLPRSVEIFAQVETVTSPHDPPTILRLVEDSVRTEEAERHSVLWERDVAGGATTLTVQGDPVLAFKCQQDDGGLRTRSYFCQFTSVNYEDPRFVRSNTDTHFGLFDWQACITHVSVAGFQTALSLVRHLLSKLNHNTAPAVPSLLNLKSIHLKNGWNFEKQALLDAEAALPEALESYLQERVAKGLQNLDMLEVKGYELPVDLWTDRVVLQQCVGELVVTT
jgi:hypothetical protein